MFSPNTSVNELETNDDRRDAGVPDDDAISSFDVIRIGTYITFRVIGLTIMVFKALVKTGMINIIACKITENFISHHSQQRARNDTKIDGMFSHPNKTTSRMVVFKMID